MGDYLKRKRPPMPAGVIVSLVAMGIFVGLQVLAALVTQPTPGTLVSIIIAVIFMIFLARGHPLARQWAIFVCVLALLPILLFLLVRLDQIPLVLLITNLVLAVLPVVVITGLMLEKSRLFFDLRCPKCGSFKVRAASFLYNKIRCLSCKERWRLREEKVEVSAFD